MILAWYCNQEDPCPITTDHQNFHTDFLETDYCSGLQDGAQKKIPIMLCGNKCDLRDECPEEGKKYVKTEDGQRLAKVKYHRVKHASHSIT